jgi:hypothetical protein
MFFYQSCRKIHFFPASPVGRYIFFVSPYRAGRKKNVSPYRTGRKNIGINKKPVQEKSYKQKKNQ